MPENGRWDLIRRLKVNLLASNNNCIGQRQVAALHVAEGCRTITHSSCLHRGGASVFRVQQFKLTFRMEAMLSFLSHIGS